jgi:hypothetical protein
MDNKAIHGIPVFFDVDDTLVVWGMGSSPDAIDVKMDWGAGIMIERLVPHKAHIEQMRKHRYRGHKIIVWSAGGSEWAEAVVNALGIRDMVDLIISKPVWYYDDIRSSEFLHESARIYIPHPGSPDRLKAAKTEYGFSFKQQTDEEFDDSLPDPNV